ncbi:MAG: hypothetical protein OEY59_04580 [Deltaproteobacteria bacterium]|nr:hypothetical protein [Deltaproteobacteria bacterium]
MASLLKTTVILLSTLFVMSNFAFAGEKDPVAVLSLAKGKVEYTKDGKKWKKVRRNKFLFDGFQIRTGPDGSAKLTNQKSGKEFTLGGNTLIEVSLTGLKAKQGSLPPAENGNQLVSGLMKKFTKSQSYTTVRRGVSKKRIHVDAIRDVVLTDEYPDFVWDNAGKEYSYILKIGDQTYKIEPTEKAVVRVKIKPFEGKQEFFISVMKGNELITEIRPYKSRGEEKNRTMAWLKGASKDELNKKIEAIKVSYPENSFMLGSLFEEQNIWVAAMDQYKNYLQENPDEVEMTPYLFKTYKELRLDTTYKNELDQYWASMRE